MPVNKTDKDTRNKVFCLTLMPETEIALARLCPIFALWFLFHPNVRIWKQHTFYFFCTKIRTTTHRNDATLEKKGFRYSWCSVTFWCKKGIYQLHYGTVQDNFLWISFVRIWFITLWQIQHQLLSCFLRWIRFLCTLKANCFCPLQSHPPRQLQRTMIWAMKWKQHTPTKLRRPFANVLQIGTNKDVDSLILSCGSWIKLKTWNSYSSNETKGIMLDNINGQFVQPTFPNKIKWSFFLMCHFPTLDRHKLHSFLRTKAERSKHDSLTNMLPVSSQFR